MLLAAIYYFVDLPNAPYISPEFWKNLGDCVTYIFSQLTCRTIVYFLTLKVLGFHYYEALLNMAAHKTCGTEAY